VIEQEEGVGLIGKGYVNGTVVNRQQDGMSWRLVLRKTTDQKQIVVVQLLERMHSRHRMTFDRTRTPPFQEGND
jgi:hypothetical protein